MTPNLQHVLAYLLVNLLKLATAALVCKCSSPFYKVMMCAYMLVNRIELRLGIEL